MVQSKVVAGWFADDEAFDRAAPLWEPVSRATLGVAAPVPGERVLDACCGTGALALPLARAVGALGHVLAVDLAAGLVERARVRAGRDGLTWLDVITDDATTAGRASTYDLVTCVLGVFFFPDMDAGGAHLVSRAAVGGRVCITTWAEGALRQVMPLLVQSAASVRPELLVGGGHPASERVQTEIGLADYLRGIGLVDIEVRRCPLEVTLDVDLALALLDGSAARALVDGLAPHDIAVVRADLARRVAEAGPVLDASVLVGLGRRQV